MTQIVIKDKRYKRPDTRKAWKTLAEFDAKEIKPICSDIPDNIRRDYEQKMKEAGTSFNYVGFDGLAPEDAKLIFALTKCQKTRLSINRFGDIAGYSIVQMRGIEK